MGDRGLDWAEAPVSDGDVNLDKEKKQQLKQKVTPFPWDAWLDCSAQTGSDFKSSGWTQEEFVAHVAKVASLISKQHRAEKVGVCDAPNTHPYVLEAYKQRCKAYLGGEGAFLAVQSCPEEAVGQGCHHGYRLVPGTAL